MRLAIQFGRKENISKPALILLLMEGRRIIRRTSKNWSAGLLIAAIICTNTIFVPTGYAQAEGPQIYSYMSSEEIEGDIQNGITKALQDMMDEREASIRAEWSVFDEAKAKIINSYLSAIPRPPIFGPRFSSNAFGATYRVTNGRYSGDGLVGIQEVTRTDGAGGIPIPVNRTITRGQQGLRHIGSGWNFEPGGMLKESYTLLSATLVGGPTPVTHSSVVTRFQYIKPSGGSIEFLNKGIEQSCNYSVIGQTPDSVIFSAPGFCNATRPTKYWSTNGQVMLDFSNTSAPVIRYPDGTMEVLRSKASKAYIPFNEGLLDPFSSNNVYINGLWFTDKMIGRNGYTTSYSYNTKTGWLQSVTDPKGRVTQYARDTAGRVTSITSPGPGAGNLNWQMTWNTFAWNPSTTFPDVQCLGGENNIVPCPNSLTYTTLTSLQIPDGRNYSFTYGPWGNLNTVTTPDGGATDFDYGTAGTLWYAAPRGGGVPNYTDKLDQRHLSAITTYPQGLSGQGHMTRIDYESTQTLPSATGAHCTQLNWIKRTYPNGNVMREAQCEVLSNNSRTFAQEVWQGNQLLMGTYYGNTGNIGDTATPVGTMYVDWEQSGSYDAFGVDLDVRPTKVVYKKDGVTWIEKFDYELSNIPVTPRCTGCSSLRTTGNVENSQILNGAGNLLVRTITTYHHNINPLYLNRNLLRLPASVILKDSAGTALSRTESFYDEFPLTASGAANLDTSIGVRRGNVTTVKQYKDAQAGTEPVSSSKRYYDTGDIQQINDANGNPATTILDFGLCSPTRQTLTNTVRNAKNHQVTTLTDCNTGLALRVTDPNNQSIFTQYDNLGRVAETAGPGDTLTPIPGFIRATTAPLNSGTVVGNNGQGPTTWFEYLSLGVVNQQRTIAHTKDGTPNGHYVKTFTDGLGRNIQTRTEVDPNTSGGNAEVVATTEYDALGRVSKAYVSTFSSAKNVFDPPLSGTLAIVKTYDALGRMTGIQPPGLPVVRTAYDSSGNEFSTTTTDAKGNQTITYTNLLGHKIRVAQQSSNCSDPVLGNWCVTVMDYDAAGRVLRITDPSFNQTTFIYDSLGRKKQMTDPDMGTWNYNYDNNGNLIFQMDAKGQIINMSYDVLNRIKVKDLPPNGPSHGTEDATYFYDGEQATQ